MSETKPLEEEDHEDDLKVFAIMTALLGIIALALWGLYYLVFSVLLSKPLVYYSLLLVTSRKDFRKSSNDRSICSIILYDVRNIRN